MSRWSFVRTHPVIVAFAVVCTVGGAVLGAAFLEEFSPARRISGGAVAGAATAFIITATRMLGAFADDDEADADS